MDKKELWEKCVAFHGHECGGLTIGYKAALYAADLLELTFHLMKRWCVFRKMMPAGLMPFR